MSKSCITDPSHPLQSLQTKPIMHKPNLKQQSATAHVANDLYRVLRGPLKGGHVLQFKDKFDLSADIPAGAWGFLLFYPYTRERVRNLFEISLLGVQRRVWLTLFFCFFIMTDKSGIQKYPS